METLIYVITTIVVLGLLVWGAASISYLGARAGRVRFWLVCAWNGMRIVSLVLDVARNWDLIVSNPQTLLVAIAVYVAITGLMTACIVKGYKERRWGNTEIEYGTF